MAPKQQPPQAAADKADRPLLAAEAQRGSGADRAAGEAAQDNAKQGEEQLPNVKMTPQMMTQLMNAELAFKKGDWQGPYLTLMSLAQQTRDPRLAKRAAEMALSAKQADDALAAVKLWRQYAPNSDEANQYYLGLVVLSDNLTEAESALKQRLADATPGARGLVMFQIQQLVMRAKDKEAGLAMLDRLVAPYGNMMETHVVLAQSALARGAKEDAVREARAALQIKPDSEIAILTLAQVTEGDEQSAKVLSDFLAAHPDAKEVRTAYARMLVNAKQYDAARREFLALDKAQPNNPGTLYALGILSMQTNDNKSAEQYFTHFVEVMEKASDEERDPSKAVLILSQLAEERGDIPAALSWLDRLDTPDPKIQFGADLRRAQLTARQGDLPGARKLLGTLKPEDPAEQAQVVLVEAQLLRDAGKNQDAYKLMEQGLKRFPDNTDFLYDFALMAEKMGKTSVMEKSLRKVIAKAPDNQHAYNALGYSLADRNVRLKEAYALIEKAQKMAPLDPFIMDSMGWVQYRMGKLNEAEAQLRKAYEIRSDPEIAVHLGEVLWKKGQHDDARKLWREARAKDPKNDALKSTLTRLRASL
ncbi:MULTISPECIES: tetratricopeptide repeat protein [unclassified Massilia]|uniref:tetratricopeptide repeat protein n=1 Tax=unclassified Massilia TaxID=2609279 RepID=UPI001E2E2BDA|nr:MULTISPECIES: tetratricopeptide repeat protein [unclassified Massilia]